MEEPTAALALLNATRMDDVINDPCAAHTSCDECLNASYLCHFCQYDFQCHAIGSTYGCITGMSVCHHLAGKR